MSNRCGFDIDFITISDWAFGVLALTTTSITENAPCNRAKVETEDLFFLAELLARFIFSLFLSNMERKGRKVKLCKKLN